MKIKKKNKTLTVDRYTFTIGFSVTIAGWKYINIYIMFSFLLIPITISKGLKEKHLIAMILYIAIKKNID